MSRSETEAYLATNTDMKEALDALNLAVNECEAAEFGEDVLDPLRTALVNAVFSVMKRKSDSSAS